MNRICHNASSKGFISSETGIGMIRGVMASMVVIHSEGHEGGHPESHN